MKYYLHFVGRGIYSKEEFMNEAKMIGISRRIPNFQLKRMKWDQEILLGTYEKDAVTTDGKCNCFGYTKITGLNLTCSDALREKLNASLNIVKYDIVNRTVNRLCGSYTIGSTAYVTDTLKEVIEKGDSLTVEMGEKISWFIKGGFRNFMEDLVFQPIVFSRTIKTIETDRNLLEISQGVDTERTLGESGYINFVLDYNQRKYVKKTERETINNQHIPPTQIAS